MGGIALRPNSVLVLRLALAACLAGLLAGCADSERLSDPFGNPFRASAQPVDATPTSSISSSNAIQSRPLPAPPDYRGNTGPSTAYVAPSHPSPSLTATQPNPNDMTSSVDRGPKVAGWTAEGGTPIVVAIGETAELIARRYGIPPEALLRTNGFSSSSQVRPGTRLIIPIYNASLAASTGARMAEQHPGSAKPNEKLVFVKGAKPGDNKPGDGKSSDKDSARTAKHDTKKSTVEAAADSKHAKHDKEEARGKSETAKNEAQKSQPQKSQADVKAKPSVAAKEDGKETAKPGDQKVVVGKTEVPASEPKKAVDTTTTASIAEAPEFRWPARGRIIQCFKCGGNDGINIAVPEGTSVKAAESGIVAYAGSELKGYGNLVLIRHPNGFVSAYANNGEISVKRGDTVKRGQTIAKSGQTGNVASPQLHFELRKGSTPVDPTQYLAGL
jgi:murein DD-endopeptidase MepM/ murein hydrolase activator NlpD